MGKTWLTSDLHFFHKNIIVYCGRPYEDEYRMNDGILTAWNKVVEPEDRVIIVGDLTAGLKQRETELAFLIEELKGEKTLIRGNHDHQTDQWYLDAGFKHVADWLFDDGILYVHKPATSYNPEVIQLKEQLDPRLIIHGHIHDARPQIDEHFNVAWDRHNRLILLDETNTHVIS